jgi:hypothetical protein
VVLNYLVGCGNGTMGLEKITDSEGKFQYQYKTRRGMTKIYGGKVDRERLSSNCQMCYCRANTTDFKEVQGGTNGS